MASKKSSKKAATTAAKNDNVHIEGAGTVVYQPITETLETNYMPYAMSVIISRAIPEIDGFKPSHRKLLYTMFKMGLLNGAKIKSANIVGRTMQLNPHGDAAIYDTMVRLSRGYGALLHPYVDSKGNFGKAYSRDMQCAASRYTEAKLDTLASEIFADIDKNTVDFVDNYDGTMKEPVLLPVTFPSVLVNANTGIAVGMASSICSFNLGEVCQTTIELMKNPDHFVSDTLKAPDFSGGASIIYNGKELEDIYSTGRGSFKLRSKYTYDKANNCIDVTEIPATTTIEAIIDKVIDLVKLGKIKDISDIRDETGLDGLKLTIDLKRGVDPDALMRKLYKMTPLEDSFSCNFNVLINGVPRVMGVKELLGEWIVFRTACVRRRIEYTLERKKEQLHLLRALQKILLDIDKAIKIIRNTDEDAEVIPNLMIGFGIDEVQAEFVAEIKLRHLNKEYILRKVSEVENLEKEIADLEATLASRVGIRNIIIKELENIIKKYAVPRKTEIVYEDELPVYEEEEEVPDYPVTLFFTASGYFKKITPLSLRMSGEHKLKDGDAITQQVETTNNTSLLFFTDKAQLYKTNASQFDDTKASVMGDYVASKLSMGEGENAIYMAALKKYEGYVLFFFENGKVAKVDVVSYETKNNRKKLINAYSDRSPLVAVRYVPQDAEFVIKTSNGRYVLFNSGAIASKTTKDTQGVAVVTLKKGHRVMSVEDYKDGMFVTPSRYRTKTLPSKGAILSADDLGEQQISLE